jgi:calcium-dependent protein kinase
MRTLACIDQTALTVRQHTQSCINDRYHIDEELQKGGFGTVFHAIDREFGNRRVAIKRVTYDSAYKKECSRAEVDILNRLDHPNICKLYETYEERHENLRPDCLYMVMELCEGGDLYDRIGTGMPEAEVIDIISQVVDALKYMHGIGVTHRDIKPENIGVCKNFVKILDFGLASTSRRMQSKLGSTGYMAPEVLHADNDVPYTTACDMWSLGVLTYVMICGRRPFEGSLQKQEAEMNAESFSMRGSPWCYISDKAKHFINCLLKRNPADRLSSESAYTHPWFKTRLSQVDDATMVRAKHLLKELQRGSVYSRHALKCTAAVARQLHNDSLKPLYNVFQKLDANHDGKVDLQEFTRGFVEVYGLTSQEARVCCADIFRRLDIDDSGDISCSEFCGAISAQGILQSRDCLRLVFRGWDVDDDGKITVEDMMKVISADNECSRANSHAMAAELVGEFDQDKNGYLDREEFLEMMRSHVSVQVQRSSFSL